MSLTILNCLLPMASELLTENSKQCHVFQDLMLVLTTLANAGSGIGHVQLFRACAEWMRKGKIIFSNFSCMFLNLNVFFPI